VGQTEQATVWCSAAAQG